MLSLLNSAKEIDLKIKNEIFNKISTQDELSK